MIDSKSHEFDQYKDNYGSEINESLAFAGKEHDFYLKLKADHLLQKVSQRLDAGERLSLLDVGCGHGLMHRFYRHPNLDVSGCDPAASVIDEAITMNPDVSYSANDGETLPYDDDSFDISTAVCVMHHVPPAQWPEFLAEMDRVTKPGGLVAIYEHNPFNLVTRHIVNNCPLDENAVLLKPGKLKNMMKATGLDEPRNEFIVFFPFQVSVFRMIERMLEWLPLGAQYVTHARVKKD